MNTDVVLILAQGLLCRKPWISVALAPEAAGKGRESELAAARELVAASTVA